MPVYFKFRGWTAPDDPWHQLVANPIQALGFYGPPPNVVCIPSVGCVPQYASTIFGEWDGYNPASDCNGYFTAKKYQIHNNCYNYALDIASNSFAWPGRKHELLLKPPLDPDQVVRGACRDGLILIGEAADSFDNACEVAKKFDDGHIVAVLIASPDETLGFPGDFHWVRCDDGESSIWSQKDGPDQIATLDFAGQPIVDPQSANWTVNCGPDETCRDLFISYEFRAWMFVPHGRVDII